MFVVGTQTGDSAQVQVIDHGHGMSPEGVRRVFEKFYRGPTVRMSTTPGLGIGLALSKAIVEQHGGTLSCHSALGEGTVFTLTLPVSAPREAVPAGEGQLSHADGARTRTVVGGSGASAVTPEESALMLASHGAVTAPSWGGRVPQS